MLFIFYQMLIPLHYLYTFHYSPVPSDTWFLYFIQSVVVIFGKVGMVKAITPKALL